MTELKLTDAFINLPVKVYDRRELQKKMDALRNNPLTDEEAFDEPSWARGWARIPFTELKAWHDDVSEEKSVDQIAREGHDSTYVMTHTCGNFECLWNKKKFEEELNKAYGEYEKKAEVLEALLQKSEK